MSQKNNLAETASIQAIRWLAHLYWCPRVAKRIVRQWMRPYVPLPAHTGAPRPTHDTPGHLVGAMVARALLLPEDLALTGYYNMTKSTSTVHGTPQYVMCAWTPVTDFLTSVPLALFEPRPRPKDPLDPNRSQFITENSSRLALFLNPENHWNSRIESPAMHGHTAFSGFRHILLMRNMYVPALYAVEIIHFYLKKMLFSETFAVLPDKRPAACKFLLEMIKPLLCYDQTGFTKEQADKLDELAAELWPLRETTDLRGFYLVVKEQRDKIHRFVKQKYMDVAGKLDKPWHPLDARTVCKIEK